jgi:hypothetical protein
VVATVENGTVPDSGHGMSEGVGRGLRPVVGADFEVDVAMCRSTVRVLIVSVVAMPSLPAPGRRVSISISRSVKPSGRSWRCVAARNAFIAARQARYAPRMASTPPLPAGENARATLDITCLASSTVGNGTSRRAGR